MDKQNKKYLKILIIMQILIGLSMIGILNFLANEISIHNNEIFQKVAVDDTEQSMKKIIDDTIIRIDLKRAYIKIQAESLIEVALANVTSTNSLESITTLKSAFQHTLYAQAIKIVLKYQDSENFILIKNKGKSVPLSNAQLNQLKSNAAVYREIPVSIGTVILIADQTELDVIVKNQVYNEIHHAAYPENEYVWVNEIVNYAGGDNYALRVIHPNLLNTEGTYLSTNMQDIKGNYPYLKELNGIKEKGELFQSYYFVNKSDGKITEKLSYARLYKPYNWIIATGTPLRDMFSYTNKLNNYNKNIINLTIFFCIAIVVMTLGGGIYLIIKLQKQYKKQIDLFVKAETELDPLTGAFTRKAAENFFQQGLSDFEETGFAPLLCMADIDNFKKINDAYGHDVGDMVLKTVSSTILKSIRSTDYLFRWGGEEFLLSVQGIRPTSQNEFANKILENINSITFESGDETFRVSISMGGTFLTTGDADYAQAIKRADIALYQAKNNGKNKYCYIE
ncbi:sensor domain-containing diguanylate cyclase [Aminipila sp.]|uniref:sensor domain-containing diguanylate cyclase n=1 Tax=Aminipila sp. TaxID=2060095 RepID=UPI0028983A99|nr:sensor domain-containing diguanylate cyclase [Aminipila sp.]